MPKEETEELVTSVTLKVVLYVIVTLILRRTPYSPGCIYLTPYKHTLAISTTDLS